MADALLLAPFVAGHQPWSRTVRLSRVRRDATLLPPGASWVRAVVTPRGRRGVVAGDGWTLRVVRGRDQTADLTVTAVTDEVARRVLAEAAEGATEAKVPEREALTMAFWHLTGRGPSRKQRSVATPQWSTVRRNYATSVASAFDRLLAVTPADVSGRVLLLHGPPGTGKTTALRALADAWRGWCGVSACLIRSGS